MASYAAAQSGRSSWYCPKSDPALQAGALLFELTSENQLRDTAEFNCFSGMPEQTLLAPLN